MRRAGFTLAILFLAACTPDVLVDGAGGAGASGSTTGGPTSTSSSGGGGAGSGATTSASSATSVGSSVSTGSVMMAECGNGALEPGETCDDGGHEDYDGCNANCEEEGLDCAAPIARVIGDTEQTFVGSTAVGANHPTALSCANAPGHERWFAFTAANAGFFTAWTQPGAGTIDSAIYIQSSCAGSPTVCGDNIVGAPDVVSIAVGAGETLYLAVDGATNGPFELHVDVSKGDDCTDPIPLPLGPHGAAVMPTRMAVDTTGAANDNDSGPPSQGCGGTSSPDRVYRVIPMGGASATATANATMTLEPVLYARTTCTEHLVGGTCSYSSQQGGTTSLPFNTPATGTYLWVDGLAGTQGAAVLSVQP
ncbi:MAG: hypothetical protein U0414_41820 [Polyangiaceae bacterium]